MMKVFLRLSVVVAMTLLCGCGGGSSSKDSSGGTPPAVSLTVSPMTMSLAGGGEELPLQITSNAAWSISGTTEWLTLSASSGTGNGEVTITAAANQGTAERSAALVVSVSGLSRTVDISQAVQDGGFASIYPNYNTNPLPADISGMTSNAIELAGNIKLGINIGNTMEATGGETAWGNPEVSPEFVALLKQSGFNAVRLPVAWDQYANQTTAEIDPNWLARVREVVQYCVDNDLYVMVNIHWDGGWLENNVSPEKQAETIDKQRAFWQQIATYLGDFDEHLLFASANEPHADDAEHVAVLMSYHQTFVDAVRSTGGKNAYRVLVIQGPNTNINQTNEFVGAMPDDIEANRMMMEIHYYEPWQFVGLDNDADWGNAFYYWGEGNHSTTDTAHNPSFGEEDYVDNLFSLMKAQFVDQGVPVVIGEFAAIRRTGQLSGDDLALHLQSRDYFLKYVVQQSQVYGLLPFYWNAGGLGNFGAEIFDRTTNTVGDQRILDALVEGAAN